MKEKLPPVQRDHDGPCSWCGLPLSMYTVHHAYECRDRLKRELGETRRGLELIKQQIEALEARVVDAERGRKEAELDRGIAERRARRARRRTHKAQTALRAAVELFRVLVGRVKP